MPYHLILPWMTVAAFLGLFASLVVYLMDLRRREPLWTAALFLLGFLILRNQTGVARVLGPGLGWVITLLSANNRYGFVFTALVFVAGPWVWLVRSALRRRAAGGRTR